MADGYQDNDQNTTDNRLEAADIIRQKIAAIHDEEPDAKTEVSEVQDIDSPSKHQEFIQNLVSSGKDIATIQTEWHDYYESLPEKEKIEVWDEFYASNKNIKKAATITPDHPREMVHVKNQVISNNRYKPRHSTTTQRRLEKPDKATRPKVKLKAKHHIQSLLFGLGIGFLAIFIFLFGFFNEVFIAPFIQPSRNVNIPVIIGASTVAPTAAPEVIIPKINVDIPVIYNIHTTNENIIENDLEGGVIHFPTTVEPGQNGNAAFFGHSSNNIFNSGKYKFAFVLLHTLVNGDTFYLTYNHTVYVYKVISHFVVSPSNVSVLGPVSGQTATATLITCDPPGTSINRLIVIGKQISPSVATNTKGAPTISPSQSPSSLPSNGPTLWSKFISSTAGKAIVIGLAVLVVVIIFRRTSKREPN